MKVMIISSDNNPTSGAFLSEVKLCQNLVENYKHDVMVVLPRSGKGCELLNEIHIPHIIVKEELSSIL